MIKNILAENMRRFNTKNLNEKWPAESEPPEIEWYKVGGGENIQREYPDTNNIVEFFNILSNNYEGEGTYNGKYIKKKFAEMGYNERNYEDINNLWSLLASKKAIGHEADIEDVLNSAH